jgi:cyclophilin family peptidyl-prolyl cis-trans isomerase
MFRFFATVAALGLVSTFLGCGRGGEKSPAEVKVTPSEQKQQKEAAAQKPVSAKPQKKEQVAVIETDLGKIVFRFYFSDAPRHCENFINLAKSGFYNNLIFHRVVHGFVIQSGRPKGDGSSNPVHLINAEFNSRRHVLGTVGMARVKDDPNSASTEFYICLADCPDLNGNYTVFGQVIEGIDVVRKIGQVETVPGDRPKIPVIMRKVTIQEREIPE